MFNFFLKRRLKLVNFASTTLYKPTLILLTRKIDANKSINKPGM